MATARTMNRWITGARPRTLPAAVVPVVVGTACARGEAQIIVRPSSSRVLNWGWRGHATALLLKLAAKADYALSDKTVVNESMSGTTGSIMAGMASKDIRSSAPRAAGCRSSVAR